jgi:glycosyltransferase involved in cell wall biosynthesis
MLVKRLIKSRNQLLKSVWIALIEKSNLERAAAIHATSPLEAEEMLKFGLRLPRIAVVPNGSAALEAKASDAGLSADIAALDSAQPLILFFGRISRVKGLDRLLRAFARTRQGILAIVGTDDEGLAPVLIKLAYDLKVDDRVRFVPRTVSVTDKERVFASARVFVLPSYSESFGNVVLEALQRSVPVIATVEVGAAEVVRESGGGLVVEGTPDALAQAMDCLIEDPPRARAMGEAGRRHVENHYSWPGVAAQMEALYQSLRTQQ